MVFFITFCLSHFIYVYMYLLCVFSCSFEHVFLLLLSIYLFVLLLRDIFGLSMYCLLVWY